MIYLDNAATTKPNVECLKIAEKYLYSEYYNPSSLYEEGYNLHLELKQARKNIVSLIADSNKFDIVFTSCGSESDNQALFGGAKRGNFIITAGEHSAVYQTAQELKQRGLELRIANLNPDGSVDVNHLLSLVDQKTSLVSVIHVNNETGAINNINEIAKKVKNINKSTLFHSDGVQAFGKIPYKLSEDIDLYAISAHKIGGLKGTGALIKRKSLVIKPYIYGGGQENGLRSGTENVFGIKMLELSAIAKYKEIKENYRKVENLKNLLIQNLAAENFHIISSEKASPYVVCVAITGARGETILHEVNDKGLLIGTGSACSSNEKKRYSRVITACGIDECYLDGVLRISMSSETTEDEIIEACKILNETVKNRKEIMA